MRQMRVDANAELLHDLTKTQQQILNDTLKHFSDLTPEEKKRKQMIREKGIRLTELRGKTQMDIDQLDQDLEQSEWDTMMANMDESLIQLDQLHDLNNGGVNAHALQAQYDEIARKKQFLKQNQKSLGKMKAIKQDFLATVDITDQNYLALAQRGEAIQRLIEQAEYLKKASEEFETASTGLRHHMQGSNWLFYGGLAFAGGVLLAATGGVAATVPLMGGAVQSVLNSASYYVCMLSYGMIGYGAYHYYWSDIQDIKRVLMDRMGKGCDSVAGGNMLQQGAQWMWDSVASAATYFTGAGIQMSRQAYDYLLATIESDARARMQEEIDGLKAKCEWQQNLLMKYQAQMENGFVTYSRTQ